MKSEWMVINDILSLMSMTKLMAKHLSEGLLKAVKDFEQESRVSFGYMEKVSAVSK